jgi:hypothetical protein
LTSCASTCSLAWVAVDAVASSNWLAMEVMSARLVGTCPPIWERTPTLTHANNTIIGHLRNWRNMYVN